MILVICFVLTSLITTSKDLMASHLSWEGVTFFFFSTTLNTMNTGQLISDIFVQICYVILWGLPCLHWVNEFYKRLFLYVFSKEVIAFILFFFFKRQFYFMTLFLARIFNRTSSSTCQYLFPIKIFSRRLRNSFDWNNTLRFCPFCVVYL